MPQFTRPTLIAACAIIEWKQTNAAFDRYILELGLEEVTSIQGTLPHKINGLIRHAIANPEAVTPDGQNLWDTLVYRAADYTKPQQWVGFADRPEVHKLLHALARDGFILEEGGLRRALPPGVDLPEADDEVHHMLRALGFTTTLGHLEQAITNHTDGNWAAANGQLRTGVESLFDEIAERLDRPAAAQTNSHGRRALLANLKPPFLLRDANEWEDNGTGYVNALFRRLHPDGAHPGLSDEEDATFRLHTVLIAARLFLRRLMQRLG
jgi:hypothetical protein